MKILCKLGKSLGACLCVMALAVCCLAQSAPQYQVNLNFLTGGPYGQSSALDVAFADQFTTNSQLRGDLITMPGAGVTDWLGGVHYDVAAACPLLATTSLSCGKFIPFVEGAAGLGRLQSLSSPTQQSIAFLIRAGGDYDPTGAGKYAVIFEGGYGKFGPTIAGQSSTGFVFQTGLSFGAGTNQAATQAKVERMKTAERKKAAKLAAKAAKHS